MDIRLLGPGDDDRLADAAHLFDNPPDSGATRQFLESPRHVILIAYDGRKAVGFVSGVELTHPDKGTEMFLYELAVDEEHRGRGIGRALVRQLAALARERGCYGMFVLTERDNDAALATYAMDAAVREDGFVMFTWE